MNFARRAGLVPGALILGLWGAFPAWAQTEASGAGLATPLSALGASARADGLGGAFVGLADDPSALFYNSAGLSQLRAVSLSINHNSYLAGSFEETLLFGLPVGPLGGFAAALQYVSWGGLDDRDANGVSLGTFTDGDAAFSVGWGMPVLKGLSLGLALHGTQQKIVDSLYSSLSGDAGLLWAPDSKLRVGLSYSGLGTALSGFAPAQDLHMGLSGLWDLGKGSGLRPLLAGDWEPRGVSRVQGGLEGVLEGNYFLRLGFQVPLADNQVGGLTGFTAGAGFNLGSVRLDYAFVPYGDLGTSHRLSLAYEFPTSAPAALRPVTVNANPVTVQAAPVTVVVTPGPTPLSANGSPKSKIEVRFELPGDGSSAQGQAPVSYQLAPYEKAAQDNPGDSRAWRNLGIVYLRAGQNALGVQCLEQALRLNPNDPALKKWLDEYHLKNPSKP